MGVFDKIKEAADRARGMAGSQGDRAKDLIGTQADKLDPMVDRAGQFVNEKTGGKFSDQVDSAQNAAKKAMHDQQSGGQPGDRPDGQPGQ